MHYWGTDFSWFDMLIGMSIMLVFWGSLFYLIFLTLRNRTQQHEVSKTPLEIAKARYARGEIDKDTYEEIRQTLIGDHAQ